MKKKMINRKLNKSKIVYVIPPTCIKFLKRKSFWTKCSESSPKCTIVEGSEIGVNDWNWPNQTTTTKPVSNAGASSQKNQPSRSPIIAPAPYYQTAPTTTSSQVQTTTASPLTKLTTSFGSKATSKATATSKPATSIKTPTTTKRVSTIYEPLRTDTPTTLYPLYEPRRTNIPAARFPRSTQSSPSFQPAFAESTFGTKSTTWRRTPGTTKVISSPVATRYTSATSTDRSTTDSTSTSGSPVAISTVRYTAPTFTARSPVATSTVRAPAATSTVRFTAATSTSRSTEPTSPARSPVATSTFRATARAPAATSTVRLTTATSTARSSTEPTSPSRSPVTTSTVRSTARAPAATSTARSTEPTSPARSPVAFSTARSTATTSTARSTPGTSTFGFTPATSTARSTRATSTAKSTRATSTARSTRATSAARSPLATPSEPQSTPGTFTTPGKSSTTSKMTTPRVSNKCLEWYNKIKDDDQCGVEDAGKCAKWYNLIKDDDKQSCSSELKKSASSPCCKNPSREMKCLNSPATALNRVDKYLDTRTGIEYLEPIFPSPTVTSEVLDNPFMEFLISRPSSNKKGTRTDVFNLTIDDRIRTLKWLNQQILQRYGMLTKIDKSSRINRSFANASNVKITSRRILVNNSRKSTRAQRLRDEFIRKKMQRVSLDKNDGWWKNFNSKTYHKNSGSNFLNSSLQEVE